MRGRAVLAAVAGAAAIAIQSSCDLVDLVADRRAEARDEARVVWFVRGKAVGTPATDGSSVFFTTGDHFVVARDAATGAQRWRTATGVTEASPLTPSCVVAGDMVVCGDDDVVAFDRRSGALVWRYHATRGYGPGHFPLTADNGIVFAGSSGFGAQGTGTMYALNASTGEPVWVAEPLAGEQVGANVLQPSVDGDLVVSAFVRGTNPQTGGVVALNAKTGAIRWRSDFPQGASDSASAGVSTAFWEGSVLGSSMDGRIHVLDRTTGAIRFSFPGVGGTVNAGIFSKVGMDFRAIAVSGSTLFASSLGSCVTAYDLRTRQELWRAALPNGSSNSSAIVADGGWVYVVTAGGTLTAISASEPRVLWDMGSWDEPIGGTVAVSQATIFAAGLTGFWAVRR